MTKKCGQVSPCVATLARIVDQMSVVSVGTRCCGQTSSCVRRSLYLLLFNYLHAFLHSLHVEWNHGVVTLRQ